MSREYYSACRAEEANRRPSVDNPSGFAVTGVHPAAVIELSLIDGGCSRGVRLILIFPFPMERTHDASA